jgi:hypothetical protein
VYCVLTLLEFNQCNLAAAIKLGHEESLARLYRRSGGSRGASRTISTNWPIESQSTLRFGILSTERYRLSERESTLNVPEQGRPTGLAT